MALADDVGEALLEALFGDEVPQLIAYELPPIGQLNKLWLKQKLGTENVSLEWHGWIPFRTPYLIVRNATIREYSFNVSASLKFNRAYMIWAQSPHKTIDFEHMHAKCPEDLEAIARQYHLSIQQRIDAKFR